MASKQLTISFGRDSFADDMQKMLDFAVTNVPFVPKAINSSTSFNNYHAFNVVDALAKLQNNDDKQFTIADDYYSFADEKNSVSCYRDNTCNLVAFYFRLERLEPEWLQEVSQKAHEIGFFMSFLEDVEKSCWQSEQVIDNFESDGRSHDHLKKIWDPLLSPIFDSEMIDITLNPGHKKMTYSTWLMAAPEMWFGKRAWQYFNKTEILNFKKALLIKEVVPDLVYVHLFDVDAVDYEHKEVLHLQSDFRQATGMDDIENRLNYMCNSFSVKDEKIIMETIVISPLDESQSN